MRIARQINTSMEMANERKQNKLDKFMSALAEKMPDLENQVTAKDALLDTIDKMRTSGWPQNIDKAGHKGMDLPDPITKDSMIDLMERLNEQARKETKKKKTCNGIKDILHAKRGPRADAPRAGGDARGSSVARSRRRRGDKTWIVRRRVAAAAATWIFRGDESRAAAATRVVRGDESPPRPRRGQSAETNRRRGRDVDSPRRRIAAAAATRTVRGDESRPRPRRG